MILIVKKEDNFKIYKKFFQTIQLLLFQKIFTIRIYQTFIEEISMPKLGQVLAQDSFTCQLVLMLKYVALNYNYHFIENQLLHYIVSMYYPDLKNIKMNIFHKFEFKEDINQFQLPMQNLKLIYGQLLKRANKKCRLNNILYEISRIQFILEQSFGRCILQCSYQLGKKLSKNSNDIFIDRITETNRLVVQPAEQLYQDQVQEHYLNKPLDILKKHD
ncbi:unnamed protein product [Paramecium pentaurelia]|uniref:Uncharacterized protein n=1 Tax=Paramecium pentaurelia TaxID=43138 RepID=A0A8S1WGM4_9CILI|nr:unnamed protein product [Paramecium pentaurelia]